MDRVKRDHLDILLAPVGDPGATKSSACHIHLPHRGPDSGLRRDLRRRGHQAANGTDPTSTVSLRSLPKTLLTQQTFPTIARKAGVDGALGKGILLTQ